MRLMNGIDADHVEALEVVEPLTEVHVLDHGLVQSGGMALVDQGMTMCTYLPGSRPNSSEAQERDQSPKASTWISTPFPRDLRSGPAGRGQV